MKYLIGLFAFCLIMAGLAYFYQDFTYSYLKAIFGGGGYKIYRDGLNSSWVPVLKNATVKLNSKTQVYADRYAIEYTTTQAPAVLSLTTINSINLREFITLKVAARASKMDSDLQVQLLNTDFKPIGKAINLSDYGRPIYSDEWQLYRIPIHSFDVQRPEIGGLSLTADSPNTTYFLDSLELQDF